MTARRHACSAPGRCDPGEHAGSCRLGGTSAQTMRGCPGTGSPPGAVVDSSAAYADQDYDAFTAAVNQGGSPIRPAREESSVHGADVVPSLRLRGVSRARLTGTAATRMRTDLLGAGQIKRFRRSAVVHGQDRDESRLTASRSWSSSVTGGDR
jgi:hypothetical protein